MSNQSEDGIYCSLWATLCSWRVVRGSTQNAQSTDMIAHVPETLLKFARVADEQVVLSLRYMLPFLRVGAVQ